MFDELSCRENEVAALMIENLPNKVIAERLGLSPRTTGIYRTKIFAKLNCKNAVGLVHVHYQRFVLPRIFEEGQNASTPDSMVETSIRQEPHSDGAVGH